MTLKRGSVLFNRYRIQDILGQGGMGNIYRAVDENLGVEVAVKENLFTTDEYARQFKREAIILANLRHSKLPRVTDHFVIEGQGQYLIMDYIEGEDLSERMRRLGVISEPDAILIGVNICDALSYMHSRQPPVLHRDIKPANVRISPQGLIYLVDFGLAKVVLRGQTTTTGARAMTPGFSPPEQYGGARTDQRSDIYSLGATLYAAVSGVIPEDSLARAMEQTELTPVRRRNSKVSRQLASTLEKSLSIHPDDRYASAVEMGDALNKAAGSSERDLIEKSTLSPPPLEEVEAGAPVDSQESQRLNEALSSKAKSHRELQPFGLQSDSAAQARGGRRWLQSCFSILLLIILVPIIAFSVSYVFSPSYTYKAIAMLSPVFERFSTDLLFPTEAFEKSRQTQESILTAQSLEVLPSKTSTTYPTSSPTTLLTFTPIPSASETAVPSPALSPTITASQTPTEKPTSTSTVTPTSTPIPTPLGGGYGQIAFASTRTGKPQIWRVNSDGTALKQITELEGGACQPDWSPDGSFLVFISPCRENDDLYRDSSLFIIKADGTDLISLPTSEGGDYDPTWSPDGSRIAFTSLRNGGRPHIFIIYLDDNHVEELSEGLNQDFQPEWSPDGSRILFVTTRSGPYQIWIMQSDGSAQQRISTSGDRKNTDPIWSPDGQLIVFTQSDGNGGVSQLKSAAFSEEEFVETLIYPTVGYLPGREADYSSDGLWLAFEAWPETPNHDIYLMTVAGERLTSLINNPALDFDPAWRPSIP